MDFKWNEDDDQEENEEDDTGYSGSEALRDGLILLIDTTDSMFKGDDKEEYPFKLCARAALATLTNKIISKNQDLISIVFFGTEKEKNSVDFKHINVFQDLGQPGAERVLQIEKLINKKQEDFQKEFGHSSQFSMSEVLWTCASIFSGCTLHLGQRKIMLFTNNDNPHSNNPQLQRQAKEKAKDLNDLGITIDLMHLKKDGSTFDFSTFYRDIVVFGDDENVDLPDASAKFEHLLTRVRTKDYKKRAMARIRFTLGEGLDLATSIYSLVSISTRPISIKLHKKDNSELKIIRKIFLEETGEILLPVDIKKYQTYAQKKIFMENDEVEQIKSFGEPGLRLLGFKPISSLKSHLHIRSALFLYPDESTISGSTTLFSALLKSCLRKEQTPICSFISRRNTTLKIVTLLPQAEEKDNDGFQIVPPGFHIIFQPFAEDIRKLNLDNRQDPPVELTEKAKEIVKKLQFSYSPESFENPVIQTHWRNIEALALNKDEPEEVTDYTMPDESKIKTRAGKLLSEFGKMAFPDGCVSNASKRKKPAQSAAPAKKAKSEAGTENTDVRKAAEQGKLGGLTVTILKQFCKSNNIKSGSKKADIIEAINDFLED